MQTIIIKIGSSSLLTKQNKLDEFRLAHVANQIVWLHQRAMGVVLVVSGAVACGSQMLNGETEEDTDWRYVAAGMGQAVLVAKFQQVFARKKLLMAQILLTSEVMECGEKRQKLENLVKRYVHLGVVPIINENDVVDLHGFGGNDFLAARIAHLIQADRLLICPGWHDPSLG